MRCVIAFFLGMLIIALVPCQGHPHGDAWWIQQGRFTNAVGQLCCGEHDCQELADNDVTATDDGWYVKPFKETVPYSEAQPSPDGHFWRCSWPTPQDRKCFFAPPPSM